MGNYYWPSMMNYGGSGWNMMGWGATWPFGFLLPLVVLDLILKGFALYRSARKGQQWWFVALLIVNSAGILPLIYLLLYRKTSKSRR